MKFSKYFIVLLCCVFLYTTNSYSFDNQLVHPLLNEASSKQSRLDESLKKIGIQDGIDEVFKDKNGAEKKVFEWIKQGGEDEDDGLRAFNHFHDPTESWDNAGLFGMANSSLIWAQQNDASWNVAREHYYQALITSADEEYAATFKTLGQLMHLISDKAVPAHVRNDAHPEVMLGDILDITHFEVWTKRNVANLKYNGVGPGQDIFAQAVSNQYAPFSALWDIDRYDTTNPEVTLEPIIGLAEYTNANFFSEGTPFSTKYLYPHYPDNDASVEKQTKQIVDPFDPGREVSREYWMKKATVNSSSYRLTGIGYLTFSMEALYIGGFEDFETLPPMDNFVFEDYAELLIPRAVGYSAALLDYFFRGKINIRRHIEEPFVTIGTDSSITGLSFSIKNGTPPLEENQTVESFESGTIKMVYSYIPAVGHARVYHQLVESVYNISPADPVNHEYVSVSVTLPIVVPAGAADFSFTLVFKGTLGTEQDAVAAQMYKFDSPEYIVMSLEEGISVIVWDPVTQDYAQIMGNDGEPVTFPCAADDISGWLNSVTDVGEPLFYTRQHTKGRMPDVSVIWPEAQFNSICIGSPWEDSNSESSSVNAYPFDIFANLTNSLSITKTVKVELRNDCGGYWNSRCQEFISCELRDSKETKEYNYDVASYFTHRAIGYDEFVVGTRVAKYGVKEKLNHGVGDYIDCGGEDAYWGSILCDQYTKAWFTPFGKLREHTIRDEKISRLNNSVCGVPDHNQMWSSVEDTSIDHLVFKSISSASTQAAVWIFTFRPSFREINCVSPETTIGGAIPTGCKDTVSWVESKEDRSIFIHASSRFSADEIYSTDPLSGGRNSAFEAAITAAYAKAFIDLGVEEDENPEIDSVVRIVQ